MGLRDMYMTPAPRCVVSPSDCGDFRACRPEGRVRRRMISVTQRWFAAALICLVAMGDLNAAEKRVALTIGNSTYMHMGARSSARPGAAQVAEVLEKLGFHVIRAYDVD